MKKMIFVAGIFFFVAAACNNTTVSQPANPTPTPVEAPTPPPVITPAPAPSPNPTPTPAAVTHNVSIQGFAFSAASLTIKQGDTVVWTNKDAAPHTVTGDNGGPASSALSTNQSYSYTFTAKGTFKYHCSIHPSMLGTIIVQ